VVVFQVGDSFDANLGIIIIGVCKMAGNIVSALIIDKVSSFKRNYLNFKTHEEKNIK
jgi:hypothetical protein